LFYQGNFTRVEQNFFGPVTHTIQSPMPNRLCAFGLIVFTIVWSFFIYCDGRKRISRGKHVNTADLGSRNN
jgi:hypothetical protein